MDGPKAMAFLYYVIIYYGPGYIYKPYTKQLYYVLHTLIRNDILWVNFLNEVKATDNLDALETLIPFLFLRWINL